MMVINPYKQCPTLETDRYFLRLVEEGDAGDLLLCYSDRESVKIFNRDNCPMDFYFESEEGLQGMIQFWLREYAEGGFVRFAIIDKDLEQAIGTIEIFAKKETFDVYGSVGVLRLDLPSAYEVPEVLESILGLVISYFAALFGIDSVITKANHYAKTRSQVLTDLGFHPLERTDVTTYGDYYIRQL